MFNGALSVFLPAPCMLISNISHGFLCKYAVVSYSI